MNFSKNYFAVLEFEDDSMSDTSDTSHTSSDDSSYFDAPGSPSSFIPDIPKHTGPLESGSCSICETYLQKINEMDDIIAELEHKLAFGKPGQVQPAPRQKCGLCQTFIMKIVGMNGVVSMLEGKLAASKAVAEEAVMRLGEVFAGQEKWLKGYKTSVERQQKELIKRTFMLSDMRDRMEGRKPAPPNGPKSSAGRS